MRDTTFSYAGSGDSPAASWPTASPAAKTTYITGPGGLLVIDVAGVPSYPIANGHGDIVGNTDLAGSFVPTPPTDEFGRGISPPSRLAWLGSHQRFSTGGTLNLTRVRLYDPNLGRFLQVDPIEGGTSTNDYGYVRVIVLT